MTLFHKILLCSFCFVFINNVAALTSSEDGWYLIKNKALGTYLESSTGVVSLKDFEGSDTQLWQLRPSGNPGLFYIINKNVGRTLYADVQPALHRVYASGPINDNKLLDTQWFVNYDGTITNAYNLSGERWFLDVYGPGNLLVVLPKNGNATQQYELELPA